MKPPIQVVARTNNLNECSLEVSGAEGIAEVVRVGVMSNVYQGLHAAAPQLEEVFNQTLRNIFKALSDGDLTELKFHDGSRFNIREGFIPPPPPKEEEAPETNPEPSEEATT